MTSHIQKSMTIEGSLKFLCVAKSQITFIRSCVNRYNWWNESYDSRFSQLSIKA